MDLTILLNNLMAKKIFIFLVVFFVSLSLFSFVLAQPYQTGSYCEGENCAKIDGISKIIALMFAFMMFFAVIGIGVYVYSSLAYMKLAQRLNVKNGYLAWIPIANIYLITQLAGMKWWPMLLAIGLVIPIINVFAAIALAVFSVIWHWKIFERMGKPGWWVLLLLIPIVGQIVFLVLLGVTAWGKNKNLPASPTSTTRPQI